MNRGKNIFRGIALLIAAAVICSAGIFATRNDFGLGRNIEIMANLMRALSTSYVDEIDPDTMVKSGADGITSNLDPYTVYMTEKEAADLMTFTTGKYGGIGAIIRQKGDYVLIAQPYKGSPADRAGLKIGDRIVAINGKDAKGFTTEQVSKLLKGEPKTTVRVTVEQLLDGKRVEHKIRREQIKMPSISYYGYIADGIGLIVHTDFTETSYDEMRNAILDLQQNGNLEALILDYRNNGGGVVQSAVNILSLFLPKGTTVLETRGRNTTAEKYTTEYEPLLPDTPIAVLINSYTASSAEIVSGAIQDLDRGVLLGERSFGKGLVQSSVPVGFGNYVKLTTAKYYIPSGRCIQAVRYSADGKAQIMPDSLIGEFKTAHGRKVYDGGGIMPDIAIEQTYGSVFAHTLEYMGIIDDFGDEYMRRHPIIENTDVRSFRITEADYADFGKMIAEREIPYKSASRRALEALRETLKRERLDKAVGAEALETIDKQLCDDKMSNLRTYRNEIEEYITNNIIMRFAYNRGVVEYLSAKSEEVKAAIDLLRDKAEYERIVTSQDTQKQKPASAEE